MLSLKLPASRPVSLFFLCTLLVIAALAAAMTSATAQAYANENVPAGHVAQFQKIQYWVMPMEEFWIARVSAEIDDFETLPALIEIAVPQHSAVYFFGDGITGTWFSYDVRTENGFDIYTAIITESRVALLEYTLNASPFAQTSDGPTMNLSYTPLRNVHELHLIAAFPVDSSVTDPKFEYYGVGPEGQPAFGYVIENALGGQEYSTTIPYITNVSGTATEANPLIVVGIIAVMVFFAAVVFIFFRRGNAQSDEDDE